MHGESLGPGLGPEFAGDIVGVVAWPVVCVEVIGDRLQGKTCTLARQQKAQAGSTMCVV